MTILGSGHGKLSGLFLGEVRRQPMLTREEEITLARRSSMGDQVAAARLVVCHLRFVVRIARAYRSYGLPMADLVQEGTLGLLHAVRKFNPDQGNRLATYAMWWIRAAIQEHVVRSWSLVRVGTTAAHKALFLNLRRRAALASLGEAPLNEDQARGLARRFDLPLGEVLALARRVFQPDRSLNVASDERGRNEWLGQIPDERPTPEEDLADRHHQRLWRGLVQRALGALPHREQVIIRRRYLSEAKTTFDALSRELGLSKERCRQLEASAMDKLKAALRPRWREEGLPS